MKTDICCRFDHNRRSYRIYSCVKVNIWANGNPLCVAYIETKSRVGCEVNGVGIISGTFTGVNALGGFVHFLDRDNIDISQYNTGADLRREAVVIRDAHNTRSGELTIDYEAVDFNIADRSGVFLDPELKLSDIMMVCAEAGIRLNKRLIRLR